MIRTHRWLETAAVLFAALGAACSDGPSAPKSGTVRVAVRTSGGDLDFDGYEVILDPARRTVDANGTAEFRFIGVGEHNLVLNGVADNCTVVGTSTRSVIVTRDAVLTVDFDVDCATTGIAITTAASGVNVPDSVDVSVDDKSLSTIPANGVSLVSRLEPGNYTVTLALRGSNCTVPGGNNASVNVAERSVTRVRFELTFTSPVRTAQIAFAVDTTSAGAPETLIEVVNLDGSGARSIGRGRAPAWSPDGTRVAFSDARCGGIDESGGFGCFGGVIVVDPELGSLTRPSNGDQGFSPAWSPARDTVAFVGCCNLGLEPTRLFVVRLGDSPARELVFSAGLSVRDPVWSPDGGRIAFTCPGTERNPGQAPNGDLCVVNADGSGFRRLIASPAAESDAAWSPDGKRIAFTVGADVALLQVSDGVVTRLTEGREPAWSPDGDRLVFAGDDGLFTIRADGSDRQRLTTGAHRTPVWRP